MAEELNKNFVEQQMSKTTDLVEDLSDFDFENDIVTPIAQKNMLYSSDQMKFFNENKIDRAPLFGQEPYEYSGVIEKIPAEEKTEEIESSFTDTLREAFATATEWSKQLSYRSEPEVAKEMLKAAPGYAVDTVKNWGDNLLLSAKNMEDVGINLKPFMVQYLQKVPGIMTAPFVAGLDAEEEYQKATVRSKEIDVEKQEIEERMEERQDIFQALTGIIVQDAPGTLAVHQVVKQIPFLPKGAKLALSWGIGSALSFDEKDTLDSAFMDSILIDKIKEAYDILPETPEEELVEKLYQIFEYTATGGVLDGLIRGFKYLKKFPAFAMERPSTTAAVVGGGAALSASEVEGSPIAKLGQKFIEKGGRRLVGLSQETAGKVPTTFEQQVGSKQLENVFGADPTIKAFKVDDSFGKFGDDVERNFDIELLVDENFNDQNVLSKAVDIAEKNNQEAVLYSKSTSKDNPRANPAFSINFKEPLYYKDAQRQIDDILSKYNINEGYTAKTGLIDFNESKVMELPKPNQQVVDVAKTKFKPTTNLANAGYILPDGTLLDLGRSYGSGRGGAVEHRDVAAISLGGQKPGDASDLFEFMKQTGAIRISPYQNRLFGQTYYKPTKQQIRAFKNFNDNGYEEMVIDGVFPGQDMEKQLFQTNTANRIFEVMPGEKFNPAEFEKFFDPQALSSKQYSGVRSIYVPEFSNSDVKQYMNGILDMEQDLKGSNIIGSADIEFFETNAINRKDYGKYK